NSERGSSVTDQRQRLAFSWVVAPRPFHRDHEWLGTMFNNWKIAGIATYGSGRPVNATITGDANQDGNNTNDRLPGVRRNSITVQPNTVFQTTFFTLLTLTRRDKCSWR